ncbi:protein adenylyltransferase SelO [Ensifer soli]|uniref:protein adenylyltransferase SelO n=1 Tax=Ciceribacter sp. sgz301302 TaxID=3342379 RepID=UPI0035B8316E
MPQPIRFDNSYARLPEGFFAAARPTPVSEPWLFAFNRPLAEDLGLDAEALLADGAALFSGNSLPDGAEPLAMAYAGHQFGQFVPLLGDGRAILIGEVVGRNGERRDIQLKGAGATPYSRRGDGRAALGPVMREYIVSEAMHALGVPTTRALAAVVTGEPVYRETVQPGAVLTRVAASHVRVGTFQVFAARGDVEGLRALTAHVIARHYPELAGRDDAALALLSVVAGRQAALVARWMQVGFIHGVMNTDNMAVSGETIDFGPCAFLDAYDPAKVFSSIDRGGRYAYRNQAAIAQWNLARLAEALLPVISEDQEAAVAAAKEVIAGYGARFQAAWLDGMARKIGLETVEDGDLELVQDFLAALHAGAADFTLAFRALSDLADGSVSQEAVLALFTDPAPAAQWLLRWRARCTRDRLDDTQRAGAMRSVNPAVIARNHRIAEAIAAATEDGNFGPFHALNEALAAPYDDDPRFNAFRAPPTPEEVVTRTFCGT